MEHVNGPLAVEAFRDRFRSATFFGWIRGSSTTTSKLSFFLLLSEILFSSLLDLIPNTELEPDLDFLVMTCTLIVDTNSSNNF